MRSDPFEVDVPVGVALPVSAFFSISGQENIGDPNRQTDVGGFADGRNTAALWLGTLPDGMTITSASGHDYSIDPTAVAAVPEPESYVLLLAGIGVLGFVAKRRRRAN